MKNIKKLHSSKKKFFSRFRNKFVYLLLGLVGFSLTLFLLFGKTSFLIVDKIQTESQNAGCITKQQAADDSKLIGKNILLVDGNQVTGELINKYPCIGNIQIEKQFPRTAKIKIEGRMPLLRVDLYQDNKFSPLADMEPKPSSSTAFLNWSFPSLPLKNFFVADQTGFIFETSDRTDLPVLFITGQELKIGLKLDSSVFEKLAKIFDKVERKATGSGQEDDIDGNTFRAKLGDGYLLVKRPQKLAFSLDSDILKQLASLQLILQKAKIDGKTMEIIDLRFDKPVVVYSHGKR